MDHIDRTQIITLTSTLAATAMPTVAPLMLSKLNFEPDELIVRQIMYKSSTGAETQVATLSTTSLSDRADFLGSFGDDLTASPNTRIMIRKPLESIIQIILSNIDGTTGARTGQLAVIFEFVKYKNTGVLPGTSKIRVI